MIVPNDFYTIIGRINDLNSNNNKIIRFIKYLMENKNEIVKSVGCIGYNTLESMVKSNNIDEVDADEDTLSNMMVIEVVDTHNADSVIIKMDNFNMIRSALNRSESELDFKLSDFDVDRMGSDSSVEVILQGIADVFDPDCELLNDLELENGNRRYVSGNAVFIPLNPTKFKSIERIKTLRDYIEKQSNNKLVYNEYNNTIAIMCIY